MEPKDPKIRADLKVEVSPSFTKTIPANFGSFNRGDLIESRYEVIEELGRGGMGQVYRVFDLKVKEEAALKLLNPDIAARKDMIERFSEELRLARKIVHKNVCRMFDLHETDGRLYITMEYVPGEDLKSLLRRTQKITVGKALSITKQICAGLDEAHRLGVIHRDLKPHNIMIDKEGNTRIMDFGIARSLDKEGATEEDLIIGTPAYMSPEQVDGKKADQRSDIYALGVILYEMMTGRPPFEGDTAFSLAMKHKSEAPLDPRKLNPQVSVRLSQTILKCLAKEKEGRYQSAKDLISEVEGLESELSTTEAALSGARPKRNFPKLGLRSLVWPGAAVLVAAIIISGYFLLNRSKSLVEAKSGPVIGRQWKNSIAVLPFKDFSPQKDQEYFCNGMTDAIIGRMTRLSELKVISMTSVLAYKDQERNVKRIGGDLKVQTILEGSILRENNKIRINAQLINVSDESLLWAESFDRELESVFQVQDEISKSIAESLRIEFSPDTTHESQPDIPDNMEAYDYYLKGMNFIKGHYVITFKEEDFQSGVDLLEKAIQIDPDYAMAYFGLCWAYEHHFHITLDMKDAELMQENCEKAWQLDPDSAIMSATMGYYHYVYKNDFDKTFDFFRKALTINPNIGEVNFLVGTCYLYHGLYETGIKYLSKSVKLDPYYLWAPYKLAMCYYSTGQYEQAAFYFEKYFELAPLVLMFANRPLAMYTKMGRYERVEEIIANISKEMPDHVSIPYGKALLLAVQGKKDEALAMFQNSEIYALCEMNTEAIAHLEKEIRGTAFEPYCFYIYLQYNSLYDNIRDDARFKKILAREKELYDEALMKYGNID